MSERKSLSLYQLASYGAPAMPLSMMGLPLAVYLTPVYADSAGFGLSLGFVGLVLALSRVFDGITDPLIGFYSDRIRTRWGRRKPFILIGMPIFMLGVWLLWIPPIEFEEITFLGMTMNSGYPYLLGGCWSLCMWAPPLKTCPTRLGALSWPRGITNAP